MPELAHIIDALLPTTTVRIEARRSSGTGFFVAPGIVVTCKHVLKTVDTDSPDEVAKVAVTGVDGTEYTIESLRHVSDDATDLAVLRVAPGREDVCALLLPGLNPGDKVHTFGYMAERREGIPTSLEAEGATGDRRQARLSGGQVEPGMSGSPVLNSRTGAVCGVLNRTRRRGTDLGGYCIPITKLAELSDAIMRENRAVHPAGSEWMRRLPDAARRGLAAPAGAPDSGSPQERFVITVTQHHDRWEVTADVHRDGQGEPVLEKIGPITVDLNPVRVEVARLFRDWASPDLQWRGRVNRGEEVQLLGKILARTVLPGPIGLRLAEVMPSQDDERWLQVGLRFGEDSSQDLVYLPWEHLYMPPQGTTGEVYLARQGNVAFGRLGSAETGQTREPSSRPLSALLVTARPAEAEDPDEVALDEIAAVAETALRAMTDHGIRVTPLELPDLTKLGKCLREEQPDIVHYVGYGHFLHGRDELALSRFVSSDEFAGALETAPPPAVVLQLCDVPAKLVPVRADLTLFAPAVLQRRVDVLVAYQYPLGRRHSQCFNQHFYRRIMGGTTVEMAVQSARNAMWLKAPRLRTFLAPTVTSRGPGGVRLTTAAVQEEARSFVPVAMGYG